MKRQVSVEVDEANPESLRRWGLMQEVASRIHGESSFLLIVIPEDHEHVQACLAIRGDVRAIGEIITQDAMEEVEDESSAQKPTLELFKAIAIAQQKHMPRLLRRMAEQILRDIPPEESNESGRGSVSL